MGPSRTPPPNIRGSCHYGPIAALLALAVGLGMARPAGAESLRTVLHLHSRNSHGGIEGLDAIAARAEERGIDALIPTDTLIARWDYGLPLLGRAGALGLSRPDVLSLGAERYLSEIRRLRLRHPRLLVIPGVEAAPYYRWEGSPWTSLVVADWNRHILALGLEEARGYRRMPVLGNPDGGEIDLSLLWPALLLIPAAAFARRRPGFLLLAGLGLLGLARNWPYRAIPEGPYRKRTPWTPYQRFIDHVQENGGVSVWAHPDAPNWQNPQSMGRRLRVRTAPYPEALLRTAGHSGFGVFPEGWRRAAVPGGEWDQALRLYARGERERPCWAFAELDYRKPEPGTDVDTAWMEVEVSSRSPQAVLESLRNGRFYSVAPGEGRRALLLRRWSLSAPESGGTASSGQALSGTRTPTALIEAGYRDGGSGRALLRLVRDGEVIWELRASLPGAWSFIDGTNRSPGTHYRLEIRDEQGSVLISNPIFLFGKL